MRHTEQAWAGIDAGKGHHHVVVIDREGTRLLSRRVANTEPDLIELIDTVRSSAEDLTWAIDLTDGPATLVIALLLTRGHRLLHVPGIAVNRAADTYRGEGKTDAKDAAIIADQARMRRDLRLLRLERPHHRRAADAHHAPRRPGRRPHPGHQPAPRPARRGLPRAGGGAGLHQPRPTAADQPVPDRHRHPYGRAGRAAPLASHPARPQRRHPRRPRPRRSCYPACPNPRRRHRRTAHRPPGRHSA